LGKAGGRPVEALLELPGNLDNFDHEIRFF
jgi:hypothetical protein